MASKKRETQQRAAFMCPTCKHPVASEIQRRKTLGIFVPVWRPGPCENPDCGATPPRSGRRGTGPAGSAFS